MATKKKAPKVKSYPSYAKDREPRNLATARDLEALRRTDPIAWREKVIAAVREKDGNVSEAADFLGVGRRTINRWKLQDAALQAGIESIREKASEARAEA